MSSSVVDFDPGQAQANVKTVPDDAPLHDRIVAVLRTIYDPELPVNIYDLGLIYTIEIRERHVDVVMTLTSPNCPVAGSMPGQVECAIKALDEVDDVCVELTWDPPWDSDKLSDEVKLTLGLL
jgi:FeS assembly SUF system protein